MRVYYSVAFLVFLLSALAQSRQAEPSAFSPGATGKSNHWKTNNGYVWLITMILILVSGFRFQVGTDWGAYYYATFADRYAIRLAEKPFNEPGTGILAWAARLFYRGDGYLTFSAALVTISLCVRTIAKYSPWFTLSMLLYVFTGAWHGSFNGVRQYLAAAVLFAGHRFILERRLGKWLAVVMLAAQFHVSAGLMVFLYFVAARKFNARQFALVIGIALISLFSYDRIFEMIELYKEKEVNRQDPYITLEINRLRIFIHWLPFAFFMFMRPYMLMTKESNFYMNLIFLDAALMTAAMNSAYLGRISIYTNIYQLFAWPIMLKCLWIQSRRYVVSFLIILYGLYWYVEISGSGALRNFRWVFMG